MEKKRAEASQKRHQHQGKHNQETGSEGQRNTGKKKPARQSIGDRRQKADEYRQAEGERGQRADEYRQAAGARKQRAGERGQKAGERKSRAGEFGYHAGVCRQKSGEYRQETEKKMAKSRCKAFGKCGGCQLLDVTYNEQLLLKEKELSRLLRPFVKLEGIIGMEEPEHYRNKVSAAFTHDREGKPLSGVYKEGTHYIIPIETCLLENKKADEIIASIRGLLPSFKIKTYDEDTGYGLLRHVMVRVGHTSGQIMVVLVLASPIMPSKNNFVKALLKLHPDITTIVVNVNEKRTSMVLGDKEQVIYGKGYIEDTLCEKTFKLSPKSFYQVNSVQTQKLYTKAIEYAGLTGKETVLDAYCGIGTIGIVAADKAKRVIGVELNRDAVKDAIINAKRNDISNIEFYRKDAGNFMVQLAEQNARIDTVFMDPPRAGSDEMFLSSLVRLKPQNVVYVSCNPKTLVRDLEYLTRNGYAVRKGVGVDMFPFTRNVESVVLITRKEK